MNVFIRRKFGAELIGFVLLFILASCSLKTSSIISLEKVYVVDRSGAPFYGHAVREGYLRPYALGIEIHSSAQNIEDYYVAVHFCNETFRAYHFGAGRVLKLASGSEQNHKAVGSNALVFVEINTSDNPKMEQYDLDNIKDDLCLSTYQAATTDVSNEIVVSRSLIATALREGVRTLPNISHF